MHTIELTDDDLDFVLDTIDPNTSEATLRAWALEVIDLIDQAVIEKYLAHEPDDGR